ncbi:MAG: C39 family peptidase, partial [Anaerolineales bacterium]|nr:C39 family peptidase [Anaerolineales bacterium]
RTLLWILLGLVVLVGLYYLPPIHSRLSWRVDDLRTQIKYYFNPPDEAIFQPSTPEPTNAVGEETLAVLQTLAPTATPAGAVNTPVPTMTPTIIPTPYPEVSRLSNVIYVDQHGGYNYCGPANLTMALKFWGWEGSRDDVIRAIKPGVADVKDFVQAGKGDKNVMPYEMADFVNEQTEFQALIRHGGDTTLLKRFVAAGIPIIVEKGYYEFDFNNSFGWMGHYQFVTGYDDSTGHFIVQDTYNDGPNFPIEYDQFEESWRSFNNQFVAVYPPDLEQDVLNILGPRVDEVWANQHALEIAEAEEPTLEGNDLFFAIFNQGTSLVNLQRYGEAAATFDRAFSVYAELDLDNTNRPYRIMWYQTSPYWAYFYTGRYADVIRLANITLSTPSTGETLEESLYWRAMAEYAVGDYISAFADMRETVRLNPNFSPGLFYLEQWGA